MISEKRRAYMKAYQKVWREANKEKIKTQKKANYEANKEEIKRKRKARYMGLGNFSDSVEILRAAADYVERYK